MKRRGLSLVEILIAIVLLGIVGAGITRMLQSQLRYFGKATNERDSRAVTRNALSMLRSEMRMIEPRGITLAHADSIVVRLPYAMGLNCSLSTATFVPVDSLTYANAVFAGYAIRDTTPGSIYVYNASATAPGSGLAASCAAVGLTPIPNGPLLVLNPAITVLTAAAPVFLYQTVTYALGPSTLIPGREALWRRVTGGTSEEIAAPVDGGSRLRFYVAGSLTAQDAVPGALSDLVGVEFVLIGESERTSPGTVTPETSENRVSIFFRNVVQ